MYGARLMPFGEYFHDRLGSERNRHDVNEYIRNSSGFDTVIDLDNGQANAENPTQLLPKGDTGVHLHPNEPGHPLIAEAIDFGTICKKENKQAFYP